MKIIDIDQPKAFIRQLHFYKAKKCPHCGSLLEYVQGDRVQLPTGEDGQEILLGCPECGQGRITRRYIPIRGTDDQDVQENLNRELEALADIYTAVKARHTKNYQGVNLQ